MVATMDVMIFITILAIVSVTLISPQPVSDDGPDASEIIDDLSGIRLGSDLVAEESGNIPLDIWNIAVLSMTKGDSEYIRGYLSGILEDTLSDRYGYLMTLEYRNEVVIIGEESEKPASLCRKEMDVIGDEPLIVHLVVY